jgi:glycerophosphoryl diester phosphodiesterase
MKDFKIIAHRGASGLTPENTMASFQKALELGIDAIELDVRQTSDGHLIVLHDDDLGRTTPHTGPAAGITYSEIRKLDAGSWFGPSFKNEYIPLLSEVLDLVKNKAEIIIEVKDGSRLYPDIEKNIIAMIRTNSMTEKIAVSSSRITILNHFKTLAPDFRLAKILTPREYWRSLFQADSYIVKQNLVQHIKEIHPHWTFIDAQFVEWADSMGLSVYPWTVNKERKIRSLLDRGVSGIITNHPELAQKIKQSV